MCFLFVLIPVRLKNTNIFQVPEAAREVVFEKKIHPSQIPEAVPVQGTTLTVPFLWDGEVERWKGLAFQSRNSLGV